MKSSSLRWRKFSPIDRDYPVYELVDDADESILLDVTRSDEGAFEIAFHKAIAGRVLDLQHLQSLITAVTATLKEQAPT